VVDNFAVDRNSLDTIVVVAGDILPEEGNSLAGAAAHLDDNHPVVRLDYSNLLHSCCEYRAVVVLDKRHLDYVLLKVSKSLGSQR